MMPSKSQSAAAAILRVALCGTSILAVATTRLAAAEPVTYEAENAALTAVAAEAKLAGYSGTGYAIGFLPDAGSVTITIEAPATGLYELALRYATPNGGKWCSVLVNEQAEPDVELPAVDGFGEVPAGLVLLHQGANTVTIGKGWGYYLIDALKVRLFPGRGPHQVKPILVNPAADEPARRLMAFLVGQFGKATIAGQQEYPQHPFRESQQILALTGKEPALLGFDFMDLTPSRVKKGTTSQVVDNAIAWHRRGGIVAFTWHWDCPAGLLPGPEHEWKGFNSNSTTFDLGATLDAPDSPAYQQLLADIDAIAGHLARLRDLGIPVLWRPLHEAEGGWFWWGKTGPGPCKRLWSLMYERMTGHHKLTNLIWVWNSLNPDWYPGNERVDVVSFDSFPKAFHYGPSAINYQRLVTLTGHQKLIAMAEAGPIPDPDLLALSKSHWSWFNAWNSNVRDLNSDEHLKKVYSHPKVITLDKMPRL